MESSKRRKVDDNAPNFIILGAQKCGTMAAVKNLNKHPDIDVLNELHFFDLAWHNHTPDWYRRLFKCSNKRLKGEKTPELIYVDECHHRMREVCHPDTKFILFLRNPVKRAYSAWNMNKSKNRESNTFGESIQRNLDNLNEHRSYGTGEFHYVQRGFYIDQIERFLSVFPNSANLLVIIAENIRADPITQYNSIYDFLGVPRLSIDFEDEHIGTYTTSMPKGIEEKLYKVFKPYNERLFQLLGYRVYEWDQNYVIPTPFATIQGGHSCRCGKNSIGLPSDECNGNCCDKFAECSSSKIPSTETPPAPIRDDSLVRSNDSVYVSTSFTTETLSLHDNLPISTNQPRTSTVNDTCEETLVDSATNSSQNQAMSRFRRSPLVDFIFPGCSSRDSFSTLGSKHGTDKITHHGYHRFYPLFLDPYRNETVLSSNPTTGISPTQTQNSSLILSRNDCVSMSDGGSMLEIGTDQLKSLHLWLEYFPRTFIYGVDIGTPQQGDRYKIIQCDQGDNKAFIQAIKEEILPSHRPLFFIIDDGSHIPEHQGVFCTL